MPNTKEVRLDYGIAIVTDGEGSAGISSALINQFTGNGESVDDDHTEGYAEGAADALESFLMAMAAAGVDLEAPQIKEALQTAVESVGNNMPD